MKPICSLFALVAVIACPASAAPLLQPFVDRHELAGAVAVVVNKDKVLSMESVGFADISGRKAMKPDSIFWIASQTKPMTATAVMMLVDEGKWRWTMRWKNISRSFTVRC